MVNIKVFGLDISEQEYRNLPLPSYSLLSDIQKLEEVTPGLGKTIIGGTPNNVNDEDGLIFGSITDQVLSDGKPDDKIIVLKKKPSGKMKDMIKILVDIREFLPDPNNILSPLNSNDILSIAEEYSYKKKDVDRLNGFYNYEEYIKALSNNEKSNYIITTQYIYNTAIKMANLMLEKFPILSGTFLPEEKLQVFKQVKLVSKVLDVYCKCMLDIVLINHDQKIIVPIDIKTGANRPEDFEQKCYFGWNYYIQGSLYSRILINYIKDNYPELIDYEVKPFTFIFGDRIKNGIIRFDVSEEMDNTAFEEGFRVKKDEDSFLLFKLPTKQLLKIYHDNKPSGYDDYIEKL